MKYEFDSDWFRSDVFLLRRNHAVAEIVFADLRRPFASRRYFAAVAAVVLSALVLIALPGSHLANLIVTMIVCLAMCLVVFCLVQFFRVRECGGLECKIEGWECISPHVSGEWGERSEAKAFVLIIHKLYGIPVGEITPSLRRVDLKNFESNMRPPVRVCEVVCGFFAVLSNPFDLKLHDLSNIIDALHAAETLAQSLSIFLKEINDIERSGRGGERLDLPMFCGRNVFERRTLLSSSSKENHSV